MDTTLRTQCRYGLVRGRFQPLHRDHLRMLLSILERHPVLLVGVVVSRWQSGITRFMPNVPEDVQDSLRVSLTPSRNPFRYLDVAEMILESLHDSGIGCERVRVIPHFSSSILGEPNTELFLPPKQDVVLYIPQKGAHNVFAVDVCKADGWAVCAIPFAESVGSLSATTVREMIQNNEPIDHLVSAAVARIIKRALLK